MLRLAASLLLVAGCAAAQEPRGASPIGGPPGETPPTPAVDDEDRPVCHEEQVTGSNVSRTVCRSKSDDDRERDEAQQFGRKNSRTIQTKTQ